MTNVYDETMLLRIFLPDFNGQLFCWWEFQCHLLWPILGRYNMVSVDYKIVYNFFKKFCATPRLFSYALHVGYYYYDIFFSIKTNYNGISFWSWEVQYKCVWPILGK